MARTAMVMVRFTPRELAHIRSVVKASGGTASEFIRMCVSTSMAQQGDPVAAKMLTEMLEQGMNKFIQLKVRQVAADAKKQK